MRRIELIAALIAEEARLQNHGFLSASETSFPETLRQKHLVNFSGAEYTEASIMLENMGCLTLHRNEGVPDFISMSFKDFESALSPEPTSISVGLSSTLEAALSIGAVGRVRRRRHRLPYLTSYRDLGWNWLQEALPILNASEPMLSTKEETEAMATIEAAPDQSLKFGHNQPGLDKAVEALEEATKLLKESNAFPPEEKARLLPDLGMVLATMKTGGELSLSAIRFLLLDRLAEAYKAATEDTLKLAIQAAYVAGLLMLVGLL